MYNTDLASRPGADISPRAEVTVIEDGEEVNPLADFSNEDLLAELKRREEASIDFYRGGVFCKKKAKEYEDKAKECLPNQHRSHAAQCRKNAARMQANYEYLLEQLAVLDPRLHSKLDKLE
jgi:hypothetical protein